MIIELVIAGFLIAGLGGALGHASQKGSSQEPASAISPPAPAAEVSPADSPPVSAPAEEARQPARIEPPRQAEITAPPAPGGVGKWREDEENFDSWAK